jgi:hypothetical protein
MTTLDPKDGYAVLINTFRVAPERADQLLALLERATKETMCFRPGFVSANLHVSTDRTRVVNYVQWRSRIDFEKMLQDARARVHIQDATDIATSVDPIIYELCSNEQAKERS